MPKKPKVPLSDPMPLTNAFSALTGALGKATDAFKGFGEVMGQMSLPTMKLVPDTTTWVHREKDTGQMARIKVVDMDDQHLRRWILYFRKKYRDNGFQGGDHVLDETIRLDMVTAPAIYAEAIKRGVFTPPPVPAGYQPVRKGWESGTTVVRADKPEPLPGTRKITWED